MGLRYLPALYPGETLHSLVARFRQHTGGKDVRLAMTALFDAPEKNMSVEMPTRLGILAERMGRGADPVRLAQRHTSLPYYAAFKDERRKGEALAQMIGDGSPGALLGQGAPPNFNKKTLHLCPHCRDEMIGQFGEPYWRRDHQLPSVLVCPAHAVPLLDSGLARGASTKAVHPASSCPIDAPAIDIHHSAIPVVRRLAAKSVALLDWLRKPERHALDQLDLDRLLRRKGFTNRNATIDITGLASALHPYFDILRPHWPELAINPSGERCWLQHVHGTRFAHQHTLRHLLLRDALEQLPDSEATGRRRDDDGLFGQGPWPCLNPLADHRGRPTITRVERYYASHRHEGGRFACECGYVYVRVVRPGGELSPPKRKTFGPLMDELVERATSAGWSLNRTAKSVGMNADPLFIYLERSGIKHPWRSERLMKIKVRRNHGKAPPSRNRKPADRRSGYSASELKRMDKEVSIRIREIADDLLGRLPEVRMSRTRLERELGRHPRVDPERVPLITAAFDQCTETTELFRRRRLFNILDRIGEGQRPTSAQLARMCYNNSAVAARWVAAMVAQYDQRHGKVEYES